MLILDQTVMTWVSPELRWAIYGSGRQRNMPCVCWPNKLSRAVPASPSLRASLVYHI